MVGNTADCGPGRCPGGETLQIVVLEGVLVGKHCRLWSWRVPGPIPRCHHTPRTWSPYPLPRVPLTHDPHPVTHPRCYTAPLMRHFRDGSGKWSMEKTVGGVENVAEFVVTFHVFHVFRVFSGIRDVTQSVISGIYGNSQKSTTFTRVGQTIWKSGKKVSPQWKIWDLLIIYGYFPN